MLWKSDSQITVTKSRVIFFFFSDLILTMREGQASTMICLCKVNMC